MYDPTPNLLIKIFTSRYESIKWIHDLFKATHPSAIVCTYYGEDEFQHTVEFCLSSRGRIPDLVITTGRICRGDRNGRSIFFDGPVRFAEQCGAPLVHTRYGLKPHYVIRRQIRQALYLSPNYPLLPTWS